MNAKTRETAKGKSSSKTRGGKLRATLRRKRVASVRVGKDLPAQAATLARSRKAESKRNVAFAIAAAMVVLLTVYLLMQPAVALNGGSQSSASSSQTEEAASLVSVGADDAASASQEGDFVGQLEEGSAGQHADGVGVDDVDSGGTDAGDASAGGTGDVGANDANAGDADADDAHEGGASAGGEEDPTMQPTDQAVAAQSADGASAQSAGLDVSELDGRSFAIVNQVIVNQVSNTNYALTAESATVNGVGGLASQEVPMHDGKVVATEGSVTLWKFEKPADGSVSAGANQYYISALQDSENKKYLRLCDASYENLNDGRGSLGVGDAPQLITVALAGDGKVTLSAVGSGGDASVKSYINLDDPNNIFWSFNKDDVSRSQHMLCEVVDPSKVDYSGTWAVVGTNSQVAMLASGVNGSDGANRAGKQVSILQSDSDESYVKSNLVTQWTFEKQGDGTYHISTTVDDVAKYLNIGNASGDPVTLSDTSQNIAIQENFRGSVRLVNESGMAVNLYGGNESGGFGAWNDNKENEYFTLCKVEPLDTVESTAHPSSIVNLFDYWVTGENDPDDISKGNNFVGGVNENHALKFSINGANKGVPGDWNQWTGSSSQGEGYGSVYQGIVSTMLKNGYPSLSSNANVFESGALAACGSDATSNESLAYLFNPAVVNENNSYGRAHKNVTGLLQTDDMGYYYYDSSKNFAEYNAKTNSFSLYDDWGVLTGGSSPDGQFFPFNNYEEVKGSQSTAPAINHYFGMTLTTRFVQQHGGHVNASRSTDTVFNFAGDDDVWIFIDDVLVADLGGIHDRAGVSINFASGEVAVTKTGSENKELVADQAHSTTIFEAFKKAANENNGSVSYKSGESVVENPDSATSATVTIGTTTVAFVKNAENEWIFADNSTHTLKFYYLERGNTDSNLWLQYNLTEIPETAIYKVNQYGEAVAGAGFAVYAADDQWNYLDKDNESYNLNSYNYSINEDTGVMTLTSASSGEEATPVTISPRYTGTTNGKGEMVFLDGDGMPYSLNELRGMFGERFILREIKVPEGYRVVSDEVYLRISNQILLCDNAYDSGVYASPTMLATAPDTIYLYAPYDESGGSNGTREIEFYDPNTKMTNGTMFSVVMKYVGTTRDPNSLKSEENWAPIYGNAKDGYTVVDTNERGGSIAKAIAATMKEAAKYGNGEFSMSAGGSLQANLDNLPGDIMSYYFMLDQVWDSLSEAEKQKYESRESYLAQKTLYTVAFYWTPGTLDDISANNIYRVQSEGGTIDLGNDTEQTIYSFGRVFGASINVPNLSNRLFVQKFDEAGNLVNGAKFAMYEVEEANDSGIDRIYYVAAGVNSEKVLIFLHPDDGSQATDDGTAGNNKGAAYVKDSPNTPGTYEVDPDTGVIRVSIGNDIYTITPKSYASGPGAVAETLAAGADHNPSGENGTATFVNMDDGSYYVREVAAPNGYAINPTEVMVLVDNTAVYANAGTADDGVTVARGPGYVVSTLDMIVTNGQVNNTLSWVYERMLVSDVSASFKDVYTVPFDEKGNPGVSPDASDASPSWLYLKENYAAGRDGLTEKADEALETHLKYSAEDDPKKMFNFTVNDKYYEEHSDEATDHTRRLYTNVGWSYYLLYQDTDFGKNHKAEGAAYDESLNDKEISNLFSRSTYVQITDETLPVDVTIEKVSSTGNNGEKAKLSGAKFALYREVGSDTERLYYYVSDGNVQWVALGASDGFTLDKVTLTTNENGQISFEGLEAGTYYLEEVAAPDGYKKLAGPITLVVSASRVTATASDSAAFGKGSFAKEFAVTSGDSGTRVVTVTVMNSTGYELPQTGGSGVPGFMIAGALLVALALVGGFCLTRRRAEGGRRAMNFQ